MVDNRREATATVVCCFCGEPIVEQKAVRMVIIPPDADDESQTLFCHRHHLRQHLDPRVPHHPALDDDDDAS
jgi:hypothetical protein